MIENKKRIVVTGLGAISSIGIGWDAFWDSLIKGKSGISEVSSINTSGHVTHRGGEVKNFSPEKFINTKRLKFMSRGTQLALSATKLALKDACLEKKDVTLKKVGFCLGTTLGELSSLEKMDRQWLDGGIKSVDSHEAFQFPTTNMASFVSRYNQMLWFGG